MFAIKRTSLHALAWALALTQAGCLGLGKDDDAKNADLTRKFALEIMQGSPFSRSSDLGTAVRLKGLFPSMDTDLIVLGRAEFRNPTVEVRSNSGVFTAPDRPAGATSMIVLRNAAAAGCKATNTIFDSTKVLLTGEVLPPEPADAQALTAVRNVFLYPYAADSPTVQQVATFIRERQVEGLSVPDIRHAVCLALVMSAQFWLGNPEPYDYIRKVSLELGGKVPTMQDFEKVMNGTVTPEQFVADIQQSDGYYTAVKRWTRAWLGLDYYRSNLTTSVSYPRPFRGNAFGHASYFPNQMVKYGTISLTPAGGGAPQSVVYVGMGGPVNESYHYVESCTTKMQDFDPTIKQIQWEQWNPTNQRYEMLFSYVPSVTEPGKFVVSYVSADPAVPVANVPSIPGGKVAPSDMTAMPLIASNATVEDALVPPALRVASKKYPFLHKYNQWNQALTPRSYQPSRLVGTEFDNIVLGALRVRRFANSGEQNGFSKIKLPMSHEEVYICNGVSRVRATCNYRPSGNPTPLASFMVSAARQWTAESQQVFTTQDGESHFQITYFNPTVLSNFACGVPNMDEVARRGLTTYNENVAYPKTAPYQDVAFNLTTDRNIGGVFGAALGNPAVYKETRAHYYISDDMDNEPHYLMNHILKNDLDFSLLVTAPYTFGRAPTDYYYRTQAYFLPAVPPGDYVKPGDPTYMDNATHMIRTDTFADIPVGWLMTRAGGLPGGAEYYGAGKAATAANIRVPTGFVDPRPQSGILTQAAFNTPMSPKIRSWAARFYQRLLCTLPSGIPLTKEQEAMHDTYMFQSPKHLKKECHGCHVHLDPLGAALSKSYSAGGDVESFPVSSYGEMIPFYDGPTAKYYWGVRGTSHPNALGHGAFLGHEVTGGIRQIGQILAETPQFYRCTVETTFQNVFGRKAGFTDLKFLKGIVKDFEKHRNYNRMVRDLVLSKEFQEVE